MDTSDGAYIDAPMTVKPPKCLPSSLERIVCNVIPAAAAFMPSIRTLITTRALRRSIMLNTHSISISAGFRPVTDAIATISCARLSAVKSSHARPSTSRNSVTGSAVGTRVGAGDGEDVVGVSVVGMSDVGVSVDGMEEGAKVGVAVVGALIEGVAVGAGVGGKLGAGGGAHVHC